MILKMNIMTMMRALITTSSDGITLTNQWHVLSAFLACVNTVYFIAHFV